MSDACVAFVTCAELAGLTPDDRLAAEILSSSGVRVDATRWDAPHVDWRAYSAVVIRSTWDYHLRLREFLEWIDRLGSLGARLWNPPALLRWNTDKRYLATVATAALRPPASVFLPRGTRADLSGVLESHGWRRAVMKPTVSADGFSTECTCLETSARDQPALDAMLARGDVMVQELVAEIETHGELSLMFFAGAFSHAVIKRPLMGDFRVQERLGGVIAGAAPPGRAIEAAAALLTAHAPDHLYARVDIVPTSDRLVLMELELVEPSLFLEHGAGAARAFAAAIRRVCDAH